MIFSIVFLVALEYVALSSGEVVELSDAEKQELVDAHNKWRKESGATAMSKIRWNEDLAKFAAQSAQGCKMEHTSGDARSKLAGFDYVGENIYMMGGAKPTMTDVVNSWGDEIKDFDLASNQCKGMCGHYTQVVWAKSTDVGCGFAACEGNSYYVYCNYGPGGNFNNEPPFEQGDAGSKCDELFPGSQKDDNGLCVLADGAGASEGGAKRKRSEDGQNDITEPAHQKPHGTHKPHKLGKKPHATQRPGHHQKPSHGAHTTQRPQGGHHEKPGHHQEPHGEHGHHHQRPSHGAHATAHPKGGHHQKPSHGAHTTQRPQGGHHQEPHGEPGHHQRPSHGAHATAHPKGGHHQRPHHETPGRHQRPHEQPSHHHRPHHQDQDGGAPCEDLAMNCDELKDLCSTELVIKDFCRKTCGAC